MPRKALNVPYFLVPILLVVTITGMWGTNNLALFDWDEVNFAEIGREMLATGEFLQPTINYLPFHEKPPLFAWMQALSFRLVGVGSLGARLPNLLCGILTLGWICWRGYRARGLAFGVWWAAFLGLSVLPALYFRTGIIDPWFNLFILLALVPVLVGERLSGILIAGSGAWLGLAVLTKGPAAGLIAGLCWLCLLVLRRPERGRRALTYGMIGLLALVPIGIWVAFLWRTDDGYFAREFLRYQWRLLLSEDAGHGGFPGYHFVVLLLGCFPASVFALPLLIRGRGARVQGKKQEPYLPDQGMRILFWVVLLLFSVVNTKIVHYSSLCYVPLAYFAARRVTEHAPVSGKIEKWTRPLSVFIWCLYGTVALAVPLLAWRLPDLLPLVTDEELSARLRLPVAWPWYTLLPGGIVLLGIAGMLLRLRRHPPPSREEPAPHLRPRPGTARLAAAQLVLCGLFLLTAPPIFAPRIQQYTQGATVAFFRDLAGRDVYLGTAYHKSYAPWFYGAVSPRVYRNGCQDRVCRFHGPTTKSLYFSSPLRRRERVLREVPDARHLYSRGGFSFFLRPPAATKVRPGDLSE